MIKRIIVAFILVFGCSNQAYSPIFRKLLMEFENQYSFIKGYDWELNESFGYLEMDDALFEINRYSKDSVIQLRLAYAEAEDSNGERKRWFEILDYVKAYNKNGWVHSFHLNENEDTLYYFKMNEENHDNVHFVFGMYEYQYKNMELDSLQAKFYLKHRDSLRKIEGDGLPPLPRYH